MRKSWAGVIHVALGFLFSVLLVASASVAVAENPVRITAIDNASRVGLANSTHPAVALAQDLGRVDPNLRLERMLLVLGPSDATQPTLHTFIDSLHDKKSANYHKWLTPKQFGERFGPAQADLSKIASWLQQQGFDGIKVSAGRSHIEFSGSAQTVEHAFQTEMHSYRRGSETHLANSANISIPRSLSGLVRGVNLQNFSFSQPMHTQPAAMKHDLSTGLWSPVSPESGFYSSSILIDPNDFAKIYDLDRVYESGITGKGVTIGIIARTTIQLSDVETFRQVYHLPPNDPTMVINGSSFYFSDQGGDALEASLDAEWAGAVAPEATVDLVASASTATTDGVILSSVYLVENNFADIMSLSFGNCEANLGSAGNSFYSAVYEQAIAQGISVFVASGDSGAAGCDAAGENVATGGLAVNGLASTPFNTAVGGTEFLDAGNIPQYWTLDGSNLMPNGYIPETVWNDSAIFSDLAAGGGGVSTVYPKPAWQNTAITGVPNDNARDLPDVSLTASSADDAYVVCDRGATLSSPCAATAIGDQSVMATAIGVGGTSASVQVFAGIMALVDQKQGGRQGLANYGLYRLAANETFANCNSSNETNPAVPVPPACVFNDITAGNNGVPGNDTLGNNPPPGDQPGQAGYNATAGYDPATGLGSVDAYNLINAWSALSFAASTTTLTATPPTSVQHGQTVTFTINVAAASGNLVPTGEVSLIAQTNGVNSTSVGAGSGTLINGVFSGPMVLPGGTYNVIAHYSGDGNFGPSDSNQIPVAVTPEASTITMAVRDLNGAYQTSPASLAFESTFELDFSVGSASGQGFPSGTVTVFDGTQVVAQAPVNNAGFGYVRNCESPVTFCLGFGAHSLTAVYAGDASMSASPATQSFVLNIVKGQILLSPNCGEDYGNALVCVIGITQTVFPVSPTGTLTVTDLFERTTRTLATYNVTRSAIVDVYNGFNLGLNAVAWEYSGDANFLPTTYLGEFYFGGISGLPTQITVTTPTNPVVIGQPVTVTATVTSSQSSAFPTGVLTFWFGESSSLISGAGYDQRFGDDSNDHAEQWPDLGAIWRRRQLRGECWRSRSETAAGDSGACGHIQSVNGNSQPTSYPDGHADTSAASHIPDGICPIL